MMTGTMLINGWLFRTIVRNGQVILIGRAHPALEQQQAA